MKVVGKLLAAIVGPGFTIKPGPCTGEMEHLGDAAILVPVRGGRKVAISTARFAYYEDANFVPQATTEEREHAVMVKAARQGKNPATALMEWRQKPEAARPRQPTAQEALLAQAKGTRRNVGKAIA